MKLMEKMLETGFSGMCNAPVPGPAPAENGYETAHYFKAVR